MKAAYFTAQNIRAKSQEFIELAQVARSGRLDFRPDKSALLVLDMQRYFLDEKSHAYIPSAPAILPGLLKLTEGYRQKALPLVFTRHINDRTNAGMMSQWWQELITMDNPLSEIDGRFDTHGVQVVNKNQYDAFHNTGLEDSLRERGVSQVVVCGVMTHLCCESTARSAFMRGFEVFFPVDGTATYNEDFHKATLLNLSHGFAQLTTVEDLSKTPGKTDED